MRLLEQHPNNLHSTPHSFLPTCTPPQTPWRARHITTHSHHSRIWHSVNVERLTRCRHASPTHRLATRAANQDAKLRTRVDAAKGSTETVLASSTQQTAETIKADLTTMVEHPPASATPPHHPARWLWWVDSNEEEMRVINFSVNLGLIVVCAAAAAAKFVTVDIDSWGSLSATDLLLQLPSSNWKLYEEAVNSNPMLTKACISGVVYTLGDLTAQTYEGRSLEDFDRGRILRSGVCGFIAHGPLSHLYYENLDAYFNNVLMVDPEAWYQPLLKVGIDQTIWSLFWNSLYYVLLGMMKFESPHVIVTTVTSSWWDLLKAGWRLWPFAHVITYGVIPVQHRLLWVDAVELVWVTILSMYGQQQREKLAEQATAAGIEGVPVTQMSVPLPGADGLGGDPAEEILRAIKTEREVVLQQTGGAATTINLTDVYAEKSAAAHPPSNGGVHGGDDGGGVHSSEGRNGVRDATSSTTSAAAVAGGGGAAVVEQQLQPVAQEVSQQ